MSIRSHGRVVGTYLAPEAVRGPLGFVTHAVDGLVLEPAGIQGDRHRGLTRKSGPREPWLPRRSLVRNDRQVSALCVDEMREVAVRLGIPSLPPEWIGGNLLFADVRHFSALMPGSHLAFGGSWGGKGRFDGGAVLCVESYNSPCRLAGRGIAVATGDAKHEFAFVKAAAGLRGLVLSVALPGLIVPGEPVVVIPPPRPERRVQARTD
jgi:hypothetical protein